MNILIYFWIGIRELGKMIMIIGILVLIILLYLVMPLVGISLIVDYNSIWGIILICIWILLIGYTLTNE